MPERFIQPVLIIIAVSMLVWILFWILFSVTKKNKGIKISFQAEITFFLFYVYVVAVLSLTIIPLPFYRLEIANARGINITPLVSTVKGLVLLYKYRSPRHEYDFIQHIAQNIFGNILLFVPLGVFLPLLSSRFRDFWSVFIFAIICSVSIELTQLILRQFEIYRTVDIDDVILNTLGAVVGFIVVKKFYLRNDIYKNIPG